MWIEKNRRVIILLFGVLFLAAISSLPFLKFTFDFEKFFPDNDPDLEFYKEFIEEFESDDNYLLVALVNEKGVINTGFLNNVKSITTDFVNLESVVSAISLPSLQKPGFGPLGFTFTPIINLANDSLLQKTFDDLYQTNEEIGQLISENLKSTVIALKIKKHLQIGHSRQLMLGVRSILNEYSFDDYHILGRAYFQVELSSLQVTEVLYSSIFSFFIVSIILFLIYRNKFLVFITLLSITLGLILFMGVLSVLGRELDAMSALYPVLMLIVGTSDVIHILSKYLDELRKNNPIGKALDTTLRQIGLATFFTSATTAIGFVSLFTSRIGPVRGFGVNAAIGVLVAYVTIIFFTTALLTYFAPDKLKTHSKSFELWDKVALWFYKISNNQFRVYSFTFILILFCSYGVTKISTDYKFESSLPKGKKISNDFKYFEKNYSGYRPLEYVFYKKDESSVIDYNSLTELKKFEKKILESPDVKNSTSIATVHKMVSSYLNPLPDETPENHFKRINPIFRASIKNSPAILINQDESKTRIRSQINDIGADKIYAHTSDIQNWFENQIDTSVYGMRYTGTGLVIDKNAKYVRESLLKGLAFALLIIGVLMGFLFQSFKMVIISFIPNTIPLLIAAAILGFTGIPLEPLTSITFVVILGIAVDDTIHFLSKYRLALHSGKPMEEAILVSFQESGKAIIFTTIVLFFGFMVMLFSYNPSSVIVGGLISITLLTAVFADLILLPVLLRTFHKS